jgi:hypothetical protein
MTMPLWQVVGSSRRTLNAHHEAVLLHPRGMAAPPSRYTEPLHRAVTPSRYTEHLHRAVTPSSYEPLHRYTEPALQPRATARTSSLASSSSETVSV